MSGRLAHALARALIGAVAAVVIGYLLLQLGGDTRGVADYVGDLASGDLGGDDIGGDVATALPRTLALAAAGAAIATLLGTCAGLVAASRRQTGTDRALCAIATLLAAAPVVWIALLAVLTLAAGLDAFPAGGFPPPGSDRNEVLAHVEHGALPALVVGIGLFGPCLLAARAAAASVTRRRTRGALMAILRLVPTGAGIALSLAMAVEATIDRPGLGSLIRRAVADSDLALAHGVLLGAAAATLAIRFVAELVVTGRPRLGAHAPGPAAGPGRADAIAAAALLVLAVALAPVMGDDPSSPASLSPDALRAPFPGHLLGTDALGRDVLGTTIEAAAPTIVRATLAALIAALIALALGGAAALAAPFRRALGVAGAAVGAVPPLPVAVLAVLALAARAPDMAPGLTLAIVTGTIVGAGVAPAVQGALEDSALSPLPAPIDTRRGAAGTHPAPARRPAAGPGRGWSSCGRRRPRPRIRDGALGPRARRSRDAHLGDDARRGARRIRGAARRVVVRGAAGRVRDTGSPRAADRRTRRCGRSRAQGASVSSDGAVLSVEGLSVTAPGGALLLDAVDLRLPRGGALALLGQEDAGIDTLLDALLGHRRPDASMAAGTMRLGSSDPARIDRRSERGMQALRGRRLGAVLAGGRDVDIERSARAHVEGALAGMPGERRERAERALGIVGIGPRGIDAARP